jgi:hypothetical protein
MDKCIQLSFNIKINVEANEQLNKIFFSSVGEEEDGEMKPSECAEFLEDKVAVCKQDYNEEVIT